MEWPYSISAFPSSRIEIRESEYITKEIETTKIRSLKERLFAFPWKPFQKTKTVTETIPSDECLQYGNIIWIHPVYKNKLLKILEEQCKA